MTIPTTPPPDQSPGRVAPTQALESDRTGPGAAFQSYMQSPTSGATPAASSTQGAITPMQLAAGTAPTSGPTSVSSLIAQARSAQDTLGTVAEQLNQQNLKMKRSQAHLLRNKLTDANTHLRAATQKLGLEPAASQLPAGVSTLGRFLAYIGDGQDLLSQIQGKLQAMTSSDQPINPADMMLVQVKMNQAQQEIEYSATLTAKLVESMKTLLTIQL